MLVNDIINSCSNSRVAEAALASIGGTFAANVSVAADKLGVSPGSFTAQATRAFARDALEADWHGLQQALTGSDHPILCGLRYILQRTLRDGAGDEYNASAPNQKSQNFMLRAHPIRPDCCRVHV